MGVSDIGQFYTTSEWKTTIFSHTNGVLCQHSEYFSLDIFIFIFNQQILLTPTPQDARKKRK